jgi:[ribosomal protein S18]-alanine N-acetyltransferase
MKTKKIKTISAPFNELSDAQWQDVAAIEAESHVTPWSLDSLQNSADERHTAVALLIDHQVAGYIILMHNVDDWELLNVTVAPELHGLGLGRQLLNIGIAAARSANKDAVFLEVRPSNTAALALYLGSGFVQVGIRKDYYRTEKSGVLEDALILRFTITT